VVVDIRPRYPVQKKSYFRLSRIYFWGFSIDLHNCLLSYIIAGEIAVFLGKKSLLDNK
jgi:hypothetical protein